MFTKELPNTNPYPWNGKIHIRLECRKYPIFLYWMSQNVLMFVAVEVKYFNFSKYINEINFPSRIFYKFKKEKMELKIKFIIAYKYIQCLYGLHYITQTQNWNYLNMWTKAHNKLMKWDENRRKLKWWKWKWHFLWLNIVTLFI